LLRSFTHFFFLWWLWYSCLSPSSAGLARQCPAPPSHCFARGTCLHPFSLVWLSFHLTGTPRCSDFFPFLIFDSYSRLFALSNTCTLEIDIWLPIFPNLFQFGLCLFLVRPSFCVLFLPTCAPAITLSRCFSRSPLPRWPSISLHEVPLFFFPPLYACLHPSVMSTLASSVLCVYPSFPRSHLWVPAYVPVTFSFPRPRFPLWV